MDANIGMPVAATDQDDDAILTYQIASGVDSPDAALFGIQETFGQLFYIGDTDTVDFEGDQLFYQIKVEVSDNEPDFSDAPSVIVLIEVTDVDEPPIFEFDEGMTIGREIEENKIPGYPIGARILATDPEGDDLRYSLGNAPGSTDAASFTLDSDGQLRTRKSLDHETQEIV